MAPPTWSVGQVLTASDVNTWFVPLVAYMTSAQHWTNNTVTNVTGMVIAVGANANYDLHLTVIYEAPTAGDGQMAWTLPASATQTNNNFIALPSTAASGADLIISAGLSAPSFGGLGAGTTISLLWQGFVNTAGTAGNVQLRAAQLVTSAVSDLIFDAGTIMVAWRVG